MPHAGETNLSGAIAQISYAEWLLRRFLLLTKCPVPNEPTAARNKVMVPGSGATVIAPNKPSF